MTSAEMRAAFPLLVALQFNHSVLHNANMQTWWVNMLFPLCLFFFSCGFELSFSYMSLNCMFYFFLISCSLYSKVCRSCHVILLGSQLLTTVLRSINVWHFSNSKCVNLTYRFCRSGICFPLFGPQKAWPSLQMLLLL